MGPAKYQSVQLDLDFVAVTEVVAVAAAGFSGFDCRVSERSKRRVKNLFAAQAAHPTTMQKSDVKNATKKLKNLFSLFCI